MPESQGKQKFSIKSYIIINLIFWSYCIIQLLVIKWLLKDTTGLYFFFIVLALGFTVVSIYDYLYDRLAEKPESEEPEGNEKAS